MKVCIDIQATIAQRAGVGRYTKQLVQNLGASKRPDDEINLFYFDFKRNGLPFAASGAIPRAVRYCPGRLVQAAWKTVGWPPFDFFAPGADLYHFPNFILPPLNRGRSIVTIHDMSFLRYPQFAENKNLDYLSRKIRDTVSRADALITDSNFSAGEIRELLNVPAERIFPVHLGISGEFKRPAAEELRTSLATLGLNRPYLLTVGTIEPRKNVEFLIRLFEQMTSFQGRLVIAGMRGWKFEPILARIQASPRRNDILYLEYVSDALLPALYAGAELFLCASFYEGFGFPPLEAMACGTPVLSSNGGSLGEILGKAAIVINEFDLDAWKVQIDRVMTDSALRANLLAEGYRVAAGYTWAATAARTWEVYRKFA